MKRFLLVPLGNPGKEYVYTRHNAGRIVCAALDVPSVPGVHMELFVPSVYMNLTGEEVARYLKMRPATEVICVYDDKDLPLGSVRVSYARSSGGHNGVKSMIQHLGTDEFIRIRIGIAPRKEDGDVATVSGAATADFVLGVLSKQDVGTLKTKVAEHVEKAIDTIITQGWEKAAEITNVKQ